MQSAIFDEDTHHVYLKNLREIEDVLSETVKISYSEVTRLVVSDLISKYKSNQERGDKRWAGVFEEVLRYYLDEQEMLSVTMRPAAAKE